MIQLPNDGERAQIRRDVFAWIVGLGDAAVIGCSFLAAVWSSAHWKISKSISISPYLALQDGNRHLYLGLILYLIILYKCDAYNPHQLLQIKTNIANIFKGSIIWFVTLFIISFFLKFNPSLSRAFLLWFLNPVLTLTAWRFSCHYFFQYEGIAKRLREKMLFVGWSKQAETLADAIRTDENHPYEIVGCVPMPEGQFSLRLAPDIPLLAGYNDDATFLKIIHDLRPDIVVMTDLNPSVEKIVHIANLCEKEHVKFTIIPSYFQILVSGLHLQTISDIPILGISRLPLDLLPFRFIKRSFDVIGALIGLLLAGPIIVIFGLLMQIQSPGPIFYSQIRIGRNGRRFKIVKIRSMYLDSEKHGAGWTKKDDARCFPLGAFMRKYNIDEFPQFFNVLKGDMSLIGPRPERPEFIVTFKEEIPHYNARHSVRPGLSGWAQIHGLRGDTSIEERIHYDLFYLENWTIWLDLFIIGATLFPSKNYPVHLVEDI